MTNRISRLLAKAIYSALATVVTSAGLAQQPFMAPDALIIVQPTGDQAMITISFSGKVSHAIAKDAILRLGKLGGWKVSGLDVNDVKMETSKQFGPSTDLGEQTGATAVIS